MKKLLIIPAVLIVYGYVLFRFAKILGGEK